MVIASTGRKKSQGIGQSVNNYKELDSELQQG